MEELRRGRGWRTSLGKEVRKGGEVVELGEGGGGGQPMENKWCLKVELKGGGGGGGKLWIQVASGLGQGDNDGKVLFDVR